MKDLQIDYAWEHLPMALTKESESQLDRYRQMTGEERLAIALQLHEFACDIAREGIRRQYPNETSTQHEIRLRDRIRAART